MFEDWVNVDEVREIRGRVLVYFGYGAINKMTDIAAELKARGVDKVLIVVTGDAYKLSGAWPPVEAALAAAKIQYTLFDRIVANPTAKEVDEAVKVGRQSGVRAVIGIGGGSAIDAAKSTAILLEYPGKTAAGLYEFEFTPDKALPVVAINLTHGTGSEVNRVAVVSIEERNFKPAIVYDCLYPAWSIDDPQLMMSLSPFQTLYTSVDAVNHSIEASTSTVASPYSVTLARESIRLVAKYLPAALKDPKDRRARYQLLYASMLAGISFDNGFLHFTHALEHPLSAVQPKLAHALGLSMLLPAVIKDIYPHCAGVLADILSPLVPGLTGVKTEAEQAAVGVEKWLFSVGANRKLTDEGFTEADIGKLTELVFATPSLPALLAVAPAKADRRSVAAIYRDSLKPME